MKPDRSNYEIWFIDWLDGKLSENEAGQLMVFLEENPELRDELDSLKHMTLRSSGTEFSGKKILIKSPSEISDDQFEYLCIASLENDISQTQRHDLETIVSNDEVRRKRYETYQKLKLKPDSSVFLRKSSVKKLTLAARAFRMTLLGLTAAAAAILVLFYFPSLSVKNIPSAYISAYSRPDTTVNDEPVQAIGEEEVQTAFVQAPSAASVPGENKKNMARSISSDTTIRHESEIESPVIIERYEPIAMISVVSPEELYYNPSYENNSLRKYKPIYVPELIEDNRSNVDRFIARLFHERIMRDTIMPERPVKRYELATAGITGINKLFGWEMALQRTTDESGEVKSYAFSSGLLKFNAPNKKTSKSL